MAKKDSELEALKNELEDIVKQIREDSKAQCDTTLRKESSCLSDVPRLKASCKHSLEGHLSKVNSIHFSGDNRHLVSGSLEGKLIIWDIYTGYKTKIIPLPSAWIMSVAFASSGNLIASGGMDNKCTVHKLSNQDRFGVTKVARELGGYDGFLSCCRFIDDTNLVTGSGDMKIIHWDVNSGKKLQQYFGHSGDVATMSISPDRNTFLTGSDDRTMKLWDLRDPKDCKQTFWGHVSDINSVYFHPSGFGFCSGSEDQTARLWDIRSDQQIGEFKPPTANSNFTSCCLSKSGRYIICGSEDTQVHVWDSMKGNHCGILRGHENRITSLDITQDGIAFATGSWDTNIRVWGI